MEEDPCVGLGRELSEGIKVVKSGSCKGCEGMGMITLLWGRLV